ncbi:MAG: N-acyl homoserine lactonase family protein [Aestuariivita sp.]|nr:N-acyl homoserine lactonase family protein [Aestuariivita sp.]
MKMYIIGGGRLAMKKHIYVPNYADKSAMIELPVMAVLFRHPRGNVLFDTGCHPSVSSNAEARWGKLASVMQPVGEHSNNVIDNLKAIGLTPKEINIVVNSHLHPDHCGCNAFFENARFVVHEKELAAAQAEDAARQGYFPKEWAHSMPMSGCTNGYDVMGDGTLVTIDLPGHTCGMMGLQVALKNTGSVLLASDAVSLRRNLDNDEIPKNAWDGEALLASYAVIREIEAAGAMIICGHDDAQYQSLKTGAQAYD